MPAAVGLGELLWDRLPGGDTIGGAPFNVTAQLARLGHRAAFATAVGRDALGEAALAELRARGVDSSFVTEVDDLPTGVAQVVVGEDGSPTFEIVRPAAYQALRLDAALVDRLAGLRADAVVYGTLAHTAPGLIDGTRALVRRLPDAVALYDVNLRDGWWSPELIPALGELATVIKLSEEEARTVAPLVGLDWRGVEAFARDAAERLSLRGVAVTAGARGASLLLDGQFVADAPPAVVVADAVGAGDAFAAGLVDGIVRRQSLHATLRQANALGALVASSDGALPAWTPDELAAIEASTATGSS